MKITWQLATGPLLPLEQGPVDCVLCPLQEKKVSPMSLQYKYPT